MKRKMKNRKIILIAFILFTLLLYINLVLFNSNDKLVIKIISPYDCNYQFLFVKDSLFVTSENYHNNTNGSNDNLVNAFKIDENHKIYVKNFIYSTLKEKRNIKNSSSNDLYKYELFINNTLKRKSLCCDDDVATLILQVVIPNIEVKKVECDPFFNMIIERGGSG